MAVVEAATQELCGYLLFEPNCLAPTVQLLKHFDGFEKSHVLRNFSAALITHLTVLGSTFQGSPPVVAYSNLISSPQVWGTSNETTTTSQSANFVQKTNRAALWEPPVVLQPRGHRSDSTRCCRLPHMERPLSWHDMTSFSLLCC